MLSRDLVQEGIEIWGEAVEVASDGAGSGLAWVICVLLDRLSEAPPLSVASNLSELRALPMCLKQCVPFA